VKVFLNSAFERRNYEVTNVVACLAEVAPGPQWVECDETILARLSPLWIQNNVRYFGWI